MGIGKTNAELTYGKRIKTGYMAGSGTYTMAIPCEFEPVDFSIVAQAVAGTATFGTDCMFALGRINNMVTGAARGNYGVTLVSATYADGIFTVVASVTGSRPFLASLMYWYMLSS